MIDGNREFERARTLIELAILDTPPEREFDAVVSVARRLLNTKASSFALIFEDRQWFKARVGMPSAETARGPALCNWVVENEQALALPDASLDPRFASSPLVNGDPAIRFYVGVPVFARSDGGSVPVGSLCVIDDKPRAIGEGDVQVLRDLACIVEALLDARMAAKRANEIAEARREINERLNRERRLFKQVERITDMGSWRLTLADNMAEWSDGVYAIHELPIGQNPSLEEALRFYPKHDREQLTQTLGASIATGEPFDLEVDFVTSTGKLRRVRCMGEIEKTGDEAVAVIGVVQDITVRHRLEQDLLRISRTDDLTGLANRAEFNRVLDERLNEADTSGNQLAVLLIDLDGFKSLNDRLGHAMGDEALRRVAERLRGLTSSGCFPARLGGDEFAVIVPGTIGPAAFERLVDALLVDLRIWIGEPGRILPISGTIGCAWSGDTALERNDLLRCADMALYDAKRGKKGTARTYVPSAGAQAAFGARRGRKE